ncbi:MAG: peptide ABC transporter substrate-binding protein [Deltaproteobacteria bacterium]|nr:peptide ABC transporter substrate-binding protein [Deltaproteobacteria bacterium]
MATKRLLILIPTLIILFLLQSYLWVPTYEEQTTGNPDRLNEYITSSIGDATSLNPIISANSASSQIEALVFDGLIDRDEELRFRGRIATSWEIFEEAYFYVNPAATIPGTGKTDADGIVRILRRARAKPGGLDPALRATMDRIKEIIIIPPGTRMITRVIKVPDREEEERKIDISIQAPARIQLTLTEVDQDLFKNLSKLLGTGYFTSFDATPFLTTNAPINERRITAWAKELLPAVEHNPVIIFHLRPGVRFHDGHILDAQDVQFTYQAIMDPANLSPRVSDYEPVKRVEVVDPLTVRIVYKRLYSPALGTWGMGILPEHLLNRAALRKEAAHRGRNADTFSLRHSRFDRRPVGCGPFIFEEWKSDQFISLKRFDHYWEGPPHYKRYVMRIIPDLLTQEMEFYSGTLDSYNVQPHQVERLKEDPRFQCFSGTSFGYTYIGYNLRRPPFDDVRVRRALGMALNVDKIIDYVLYGQGERITGPFVIQSDYYDHHIPPVPYDPQGALRLLKEAGWEPNKEGWLEKDGKKFQFTLITNSGNDIRKAVLAIAQDAWKQIGIDVRTDVLEWSVFIQERVNKLDFDALILGWVMGIEPDLYQIWHSSQTRPHQLNFVGFKNAEADDLIVKIRREYNHKKQVAYCHRLHKLIAAKQPYTFLYVGKWTAVLDKLIIIKDMDQDGVMLYKRIKPTKTGDYTFHFNKWIKVPEMPQLSTEGW